MEAYATAAQVYAAGLVFARVGAMIMLVPGLGDASVPPRIRLSFAFVMCLILTPLVAPGLTVPATIGEGAGALIRETLIGLMIGSILRLFLSSLATAGEVVSIQTTLSFAQTANPSGQPTTTISTFLGLMGTVLVMSTDLHHLFFGAMFDSYKLFPFGRSLMTGDAATLAVQTVAGSFALGIQLAAPVIVFSLVFNLATGLVGRVMPQFQIFFVATPLSVMLGLSVFALSLGVIGMVWTSRYRELLEVFS
ncbi:MAG: flagellar type III secretion system protein FliR [Caulobacterales bacterium]|nr:flagellar type III secretion system protein FliR [Caulobacterales bacterium]